MLFRIQHLDLPGRPFFILSENGSLTADFNSTLFNQQSDLLGSYSYPGTMPLEPNRALIRNTHYIVTSNKARVVNAMMWLGNVPFKQVKLYYSIENQVINYNLYYDLSFISNALKTLKLYKLVDSPENDGQIPFDNIAARTTYMNATVTGAKGEYPMVYFPVKNDGAYKDDAYVATDAYNAGVAYAVGQKFTYTNNRVYEVTTATTAGQTPISNPEKFNDITVYPDIVLPVSKIINRWELADDGTSGFVCDTADPINHTDSPAFYLVYILKRIARYFGFTATGNWLNDDFANKIVVFSNIPQPNAALIPDYAYFMPDILVSDFLMAVRTEFGLLMMPDPTRGTWLFESLHYLETASEVVDLQECQVANYRELETQSQAYVISQGYDSKDSAFSELEKRTVPQAIVGDASTAIQQDEISLTSVVTKMITEQVATPPGSAAPIAAQWRIPYVKMPVFGATPMDQASTVGYTDRNAFALRFLIYRGMQANDAGYNYPYASNDTEGTADTNTLSLTDSLGALPAIIALYTYICNSKPFEMVFEMAAALYARIAANKRIVVRDFNFASVRCLIDQNSVDFINDKDKVDVKLTLYPRVWPDNDAQILPAEVAPPPPPPYDNGTVYVRRGERNPTTYTSPIPPNYTTHQRDVYVQFFEDEAHTMPKDVVNLTVRYRWDTYIEASLVDSRYIDVVCTSTPGTFEYTIYPNAPQDSTQGPSNHYTWDYTIIATADYGVLDPLPYP